MSKVADPPGPAGIATGFLQLIFETNVETCPATRLLPGHSDPKVVVDFPVEVIPKLGVELALESITMAQALPPVHDGRSSPA
jgi:hypothetical protein